MNDPDNIVSGIQQQCERLRTTVLPEYDAIPTGGFGAAMIRADIKHAERAIASGDVLDMLRVYKTLKDIES